MIQHILQGTKKLRQTEVVPEIQEAFASISEAVFSFLSPSPNNLEATKQNSINVRCIIDTGYNLNIYHLHTRTLQTNSFLFRHT